MADLGLTMEAQATLERAFDDAKQWKRKRMRLRGSGPEGWEEAKTQFEKNKSDIRLEYDQNLNSEEVSKELEKQLRFVMQVVQQQATSTFAKKGADFTRDPELWIAFFAQYPLLFNFRERESKVFDKKEFSLDANAELINDCLGANTPKNIADSFIKALQKASGKVVETSSENEHLQYLTLIRSYDKASTLTIYRAELKLEVKKVRTICAGTAKQDLHIDYDRTVFEINNALAQVLYEPLMNTAKDELVTRLTAFFLAMAKEEFDNFDAWLKNL